MSGIPGRAGIRIFWCAHLAALSLLTGVFPWPNSHTLLFPIISCSPSWLLLGKRFCPPSEGTVSVNFVFFLSASVI